MQVVRSRFRPEFLNRIDEIILFHRLRRETWEPSSTSSSSVSPSCWRRKIVLEPTPRRATGSRREATTRPMGEALKRVMQKELQDALAERLLAGRSSTARMCGVGGRRGLTLDGRPAKGGQGDNVVRMKKGA